MPYACADRVKGNCSGRAYKRKGVAWRLCRRHWHELLALLAWAATPTTEADEETPNEPKS